MKILKIFCFSLLIWPLFFLNAEAQKFEIAPYGGGFFSGELGKAPFEEFFDEEEFDEDRRELKTDGVYGFNAGGYLTESFLLSGNFSYINHFEFEGTDPRSRGFLYDVLGTFHFNTASRVQPYVSFGVGGLTAMVEDFEGDLADFEGPFVTNPEGQVVPVSHLAPWEDGDTWFNFSYGGGVKAVRLWGPVGLMAEFRGRTLPNFLDDHITWFEAKGGLTFTFGER